VQRPRSLSEDERGATLKPPRSLCCAPAPAVMEFDASGALVQAWGGPGAGHPWPDSEHGIHVDDRDNVWLAGNGARDGMLLKFTRDGTFLMKIGEPGVIGNDRDTRHLNRPASVVVDPATREVFVADGYGNRRIVVFDANTGAYKRHWGAYGNRPDDKASKARAATGPAPQQFNTPHGITVSNDGIVYVSDRANNRVQSFRLDGTFLKEGFVKRGSRGTGTAFGVALSADPEQRFIYVADGSNERIAILDRASLEEIGQIGGPGRKAGEFFHIHSLGVDPQGNLVAGESQGYRVQKFVYKGLSTAAAR
jgi:DNA-binding beta-propeller fold protein YncE